MLNWAPGIHVCLLFVTWRDIRARRGVLNKCRGWALKGRTQSETRRRDSFSRSGQKEKRLLRNLWDMNTWSDELCSLRWAKVDSIPAYWSFWAPAKPDRCCEASTACSMALLICIFLLFQFFFFFCIWLGGRGRYEKFLNPLDARSQHLKTVWHFGKICLFQCSGWGDEKVERRCVRRTVIRGPESLHAFNGIGEDRVGVGIEM